MKITWHGHSCFEVEENGYRAVFDPFDKGAVPGLNDICLTADAVYCSHGHADHNAAGLVTIKESGAKPFEVKACKCFHDDKEGTLRGDNLIHIGKTASGLKFIHCGDLGHLPDKALYDEMADADVIMIPVGGFFTIDAATAKQITDTVKPRIVIPMHYSSESFGYEVLAKLDAFTGLCDNVTEVGGRELEITKDTPCGVYTLKY